MLARKKRGRRDAAVRDTLKSVRSTVDTVVRRLVGSTDPEYEDLVVGMNAVSTELQAGGYGDRLLAAVFPFRDEKGAPVYWIYNYKRGAFYPFVPAAGEMQRDSERELRLQAQIGADLPVEAQLERWFPLWDIPI